MRYAALLIALLAVPAQAQTSSGRGQAFDGIWVSTPFPAVRISTDDPIQLPISVHNAGARPQRVDLAIDRVPAGWKASLMGEGRQVGAVFVGPDSKTDLTLHVTPPDEAKPTNYELRITGKAGSSSYALPLQLTLGEVSRARIALEPESPDIRGAPDSEFTYKLAVRNESGRDALISLQAAAPPGFQTSFTKEFGSQQITSIPVKAGASENVEVKIKPSQGIRADTYRVQVRARSENAEATTALGMTVTGQPRLSISGTDERVSGRAYAGEETPLALVVSNTGTAPAQNIELSSTEPSGWKIQFDQKAVGAIPPGETREVKALITPSAQAVAGDYMVTLRANGESVSDSSEFRITVLTSTLWGAVGIAIIASAVLVLVVAMMRYGRR